MQNNIEIEKVWQDDEFFEAKITCSAKLISANTLVYLTDTSVDELLDTLRKFLDGNADDQFWESGTKGEGTTSCISFTFLRADLLGHVKIEVFMELDDGGSLSKHNCCFYLNTEQGLLNEFLNNLPKLKEKQIGTKVMLNHYQAD